MRTRDVQVGQTYLVEIPHRLPHSCYPRRDAAGGVTNWWRLDWLRGCRLRLSVTAVDPESTPPMVDGLHVVRDSYVEIDLSGEQVAALGLPPGDYRVSGLLRAGDGARRLERGPSCRRRCRGRLMWVILSSEARPLEQVTLLSM
jgi:hypothetical protein